MGHGASPSQRLVREEHTDQDRHGSDQEPYGQVSQSPGPLRATACGQGPERGEAEPGHGVQRIAIDDRGNSPDQPQRCGNPHENPEALSACSSSSAHFLTLRVPVWDTVSISSSGSSRYSLRRPPFSSRVARIRACISSAVRKLDRIAGSHLVAIRSKLSVQARRTRGVVKDLAPEVACRRGEHPDFFALRWPRGTTSSRFGRELYSLRLAASVLSRRLTLRAALFGWIMPLPAALSYSLCDSSLMRRAPPFSPPSTAPEKFF